MSLNGDTCASRLGDARVGGARPGNRRDQIVSGARDVLAKFLNSLCPGVLDLVWPLKTWMPATSAGMTVESSDAKLLDLRRDPLQDRQETLAVARPMMRSRLRSCRRAQRVSWVSIFLPAGVRLSR